jgi:hypothetical protein
MNGQLQAPVPLPPALIREEGGWLQSQAQGGSEHKILCPSAGIETRFSGRPAYMLGYCSDRHNFLIRPA